MNNEPTLFIDPVRNSVELVEPQTWGAGVIPDEVPPESNSVDDLIRQLAEGKAAKDELAVLKPVLAYALSKLERKQLRVRAADMDTLAAKYTLQAKADGQGGLVLRSVTVL